MESGPTWSRGLTLLSALVVPETRGHRRVDLDLALLVDDDVSTTGIAESMNRFSGVQGQRERGRDLPCIAAGGIATVIGSDNGMSGADSSSKRREDEDESSRTHIVM